MNFSRIFLHWKNLLGKAKERNRESAKQNFTDSLFAKFYGSKKDPRALRDFRFLIDSLIFFFAVYFVAVADLTISTPNLRRTIFRFVDPSFQPDNCSLICRETDNPLRPS